MYRYPGKRQAVVGLTLLLLMVAGLAVGSGYGSHDPSNVTLGWGMAALVLSLGLWAGRRDLRVCLVVDEAGVLVVNSMGRYQVAWDQIASFEMGKSKDPSGRRLCLVLVTRAGAPAARIPIEAVRMKPDGYDRADEIAAELNAVCRALRGAEAPHAVPLPRLERPMTAAPRGWLRDLLRRWPWLPLALLPLGAGLSLIGLTTVGKFGDPVLAQTGNRITGRVVSLHPPDRLVLGDRGSMTVSFIVDDHLRQPVIHFFGKHATYRAGQSVQLLYDPQDPGHVGTTDSIDVPWTTALPVLSLSISGLSCLLVGVALAFVWLDTRIEKWLAFRRARREDQARDAAGGSVQEQDALAAFYAHDERRRTSPQTTYGSGWRDAAGRRYRLNWIHDTGELYLVCEWAPADQPGAGAVRLLAGGWAQREVERYLVGWSQAIAGEDSEAWLTRQVHRGRSARRRARHHRQIRQTRRRRRPAPPASSPGRRAWRVAVVAGIGLAASAATFLTIVGISVKLLVPIVCAEGAGVGEAPCPDAPMPLMPFWAVAMMVVLSLVVGAAVANSRWRRGR